MGKKKLELYLVRHGESKGNTGEWENVSPEIIHDPPLTDKGIRQAELLGEYFAQCPLDCILTSGLHRSIRTGCEVAKRQPENGAKQVEVHGIFSECGISPDCKGRMMSDIMKDYPVAVPAYLTDVNAPVIYYSDRANDNEHLERGIQAMEYILNRFHSGEKVMVAAHAAFNTFLMYAALKVPFPDSFDPQFYNTSVTKIDIYEEGQGAICDIHLVYQNSVAHLIKEYPELRF